jgi:hypothetical protein
MPQRAKSSWLSHRISAGPGAATDSRGTAGRTGAPSPDIGMPWLHSPAPRVRSAAGDRTCLGLGLGQSSRVARAD